MTTTKEVQTLQVVLDKADPVNLADALRKVKLGTVLTPKRKTFSSLSSSDTHDVTDVEHGSNPPILSVTSLRVTAGAAAAGVRTVSDVSDSATAAIATLSDDGTTLVFEAGVTGFVLEYIPRADAVMTDEFEPST